VRSVALGYRRARVGPGALDGFFINASRGTASREPPSNAVWDQVWDRTSSGCSKYWN